MNADLLSKYENDGFINAVPVFCDDEYTEHRERVLSIINEYKIFQNDFRRKSNLLFKPFDDILRSPALVSIIESLIGTNFTVWDMMWWIKFPGDNKHVSLHQDAHYWNFDVDRAAVVWMPFCDITMDHGPVEYLVGSHKLGSVSHRDIKDESNLLRRGQTAQIQSQQFESVFSIMNGGSVSIHSPFVLHRSAPNTSNQIRIACNIQYISFSSPQRIKDKKEISSFPVSGKDDYGFVETAPIPSDDVGKNLDLWRESLNRQQSNYYALPIN